MSIEVVKNKIDKFSFFPFHWSFDQDKSEDNITIRAYGWNKKNESVCCIINDFTIPVWIELSDEIEWTDGKVNLLKDKLKKITFGRNAPDSIEFKKMQRLYFADVVKTAEGGGKKKDSSTNSSHRYSPLLFPFLQLNFKGLYAISTFMKSFSETKLNYYDRVDINKFRECKIHVQGVGDVKLKFHCYESSISPVLKLFAVKKLPSSSWIHIDGGVRVEGGDKITTKKNEYIVSYKKMNPFTEEECLKMPIVYPKVASYDIECYSSKAPAFPNALLPGDKIFQIGVSVLQQKGSKKQYEKYLLTIGECEKIKDVDQATTANEYVKILSFKTERELFYGYRDLIIELDPDVIIGYNIFKFDLTYMDDRAVNHINIDSTREYSKMGCIKNKISKMIPISWESSAYGKQEMKYLEIEGRLMIDLFPYVVRSFKLTNYKLETVCNEFLKTNKDDLSASDIFKLYKDSSPKNTAIIGKYCVQDTWVTLLLYEKLLVWFDLVETATTNGVPIFYLYTKGQQIKMYSQLLKYCYDNNIVVQSKVLEPKEGEEYSGAFVSDPIPGIYKMILPFDFASLYPSIIISHNVDYSKLVVDESIPDSDCHVFEWDDHVNCCHDPDVIEKNNRKKEKIDKRVEKLVEQGVSKKDAEEQILSKEKPTKQKKTVCGHFRYRFLKQDVSGKGVVPTLIENLLKARKDTRKIIAKNEEKIQELEQIGDEASIKEYTRLKEINLVLDKRQVAYKVSANSMYGAMGVKVGYLPFLPGAMCVTAKGRESIKKASRFLESDCGGKVIYNDTDSAYTYFPCLEGKSMEEVWEYALNVVEKVKTLFPPPMKLEFEEKAYTKFLILTKKRYAAFAYEPGKKDEKMIKRGIVLTRRDNCKFLTKLYEKIICDLMKNADAYSKIGSMENVRDIYGIEQVRNLTDLIVTNINSLFEYTLSHKDFVITKGMKQLAHKGKSDPVHIHVARKMIGRGQPVEDGARIEYVLLDKGETKYSKSVRVAEKAEDVGYYMEHRDILKIDFLTYLQRQCMIPIDELLEVGLKIEGFVEEQFTLRLQKKKYVFALNDLFSPKLTFE